MYTYTSENEYGFLITAVDYTNIKENRRKDKTDV